MKNLPGKLVEKQKEVVELNEKATLIISEKLKKDIDYLHLKCSGLEWSGILLYNIEKGTISKPNDLIIKAERLFLMDIGTSASTEYDYDESLLDMWEQIPDSENMKMGHIHTHHGMGIYFSVTDMDELHDNAPNHNYYLSLIVGYKPGETYKAKIAINSKKEGGRMSYSDSKGKNRWIKMPNEEILLTIDCEVLYEEEDCHDINLFNRHKEILKIKKEKELKNNALFHNSFGHNRFSTPMFNHSKGKIGFTKSTREVNSSNLDLSSSNIVSLVTKIITCDLTYEDTLLKAIEAQEKLSEAELELYYEIIGDKFEEYAELFFADILTNDDLINILNKSIYVLNTFIDRPIIEKVSDILSEKILEYGNSSHLETIENKQLDNNLNSDSLWMMY